MANKEMADPLEEGSQVIEEKKCQKNGTKMSAIFQGMQDKMDDLEWYVHIGLLPQGLITSSAATYKERLFTPWPEMCIWP